MCKEGLWKSIGFGEMLGAPGAMGSCGGETSSAAEAEFFTRVTRRSTACRKIPFKSETFLSG
jgi:hypothetical protein